MEMDLAGWLVTGFAILITGISKSGLGGALGGLAVPFMSMWMSPRDAVAVMLPVLITMDMVGIRAWRGKADWQDLRTLIPGALVGIALGTLAFWVMSDRVVKGSIGLIAVAAGAGSVSVTVRVDMPTCESSHVSCWRSDSSSD